MQRSGKRFLGSAVMLALVAGGLAVSAGCGGGEEAPQAEVAKKKGGKKKEKQAEPAADPGPAEPLPTLLATQAVFVTEGGKPKPQPATLVLLRNKGTQWYRTDVVDPDSNVFHKAVAWRDGILTIGAMKALVKHWTKGPDGAWTGRTLWEKSWGGKFDRMRDIEIGDVDGDGKDEFYATPSGRNRASGESQPGSVVRYDFVDGAFVRSTVVDFAESHAKEILVTDTDGDEKDELYVVREAHTVKEGGATRRVDPVRIVRYTPAGKAWGEQVVATLDDDQCRFLVPGDVDADGTIELVAAGFKSGLWLLESGEGGVFTTTLVDGDSGGFEHATHVADLDGDGKVELYVAADEQKAFRRYTWNGTSFDRVEIAPIGPASRSHITWNLQNGTF